MAGHSKSFDVSNPSRHVTDPKNYGTAQRTAGVPKHLYRFIETERLADTQEGHATIVVAWKGRDPVYNEMFEATTPDELHEAIAAGWSETGPVMPLMPTETPAPLVGRRAKRESAAA